MAIRSVRSVAGGVFATAATFAALTVAATPAYAGACPGGQIETVQFIPGTNGGSWAVCADALGNALVVTGGAASGSTSSPYGAQGIGYVSVNSTFVPIGLTGATVAPATSGAPSGSSVGSVATPSVCLYANGTPRCNALAVGAGATPPSPSPTPTQWVSLTGGGTALCLLGNCPYVKLSATNGIVILVTPLGVFPVPVTVPCTSFNTAPSC